MIGEYKIATGWRIFIFVVAPAMIIGFSILATMQFTSNPIDWTLVIILVPVSLGMITIGILGLGETIFGKVIITKDSISQRKIFKVNTILLENIKGFRRNEKFIVVVPNIPNQKQIQISVYIAKYYWLDRWIDSNFIDLDVLEKSEEENRILQNDELGITFDSREARLKEAKRVALLINILGFISVVWLFFPKPYSLCVSFAMILPFVAFMAIYFYRGLIKLDDRNNSPYPFVALGVLLPILGLLARTLWDYNLIYDDHIWITSLSGALIFLLILYFGTKEIKLKKFVDFFFTASLALLMFGYNYSVYVIVNCHFDKSNPQIFESKIIAKETSSGQTTTYYLILEPWGPRKEKNKVSVDEDLFNSISTNEHVIVYLKHGLLETNWFYLEKRIEANFN